jgi:hypothetical protein
MKPVLLVPCLAALASVGAALSVTSSAHAYCRTTTVERPAGMCPEDCITDGTPLYWGKADPLFTMNENGFPDIDDTTATQTISRSFDQWNEVECNGTPIGLDIRGASGTTSLEVGPVEDEPNDNVIVYFSAEHWADEGLPGSAYALTAIWYNKANGEILGADMHFNGGMGRLTNCADRGCNVGEVDLANVATHEAGHFIGLAHSGVKHSTMFCSAEQNEIEKRSLEPDDVAGACDIYKGAADAPDGWLHTVSLNAGVQPAPSGRSGGCTVSPGTRASGLLGLALGVAILGLQRRRRLNS